METHRFVIRVLPIRILVTCPETIQNHPQPLFPQQKQESSRRRNINKLPTVPHRCLQPFEHQHSQSLLTGILWTHALDKGHQRQCPGLSSFLVFFPFPETFILSDKSYFWSCFHQMLQEI